MLLATNFVLLLFVLLGQTNGKNKNGERRQAQKAAAAVSVWDYVGEEKFNGQQTPKATARFLWLTQTAMHMPLLFKRISERNDSDVICLYWQSPPAESALFLPNSTWTQGRNTLYAAGQQLQRRERTDGTVREYDYMIFSDEDVRLKVESKHKLDEDPVEFLHSALVKYEPVVGFGRYVKASIGRRGVTSLCSFDAILNAVHKSVLPHLLPYEEKLDGLSVWLSQAVFAWQVCAMYPGQALRFGWMRIVNEQHREYTRTSVALRESGGIWGSRTREAVLARLPAAYHHCIDIHQPRPWRKDPWMKCKALRASETPAPLLGEKKAYCAYAQRQEEPSFCENRFEEVAAIATTP